MDKCIKGVLGFYIKNVFEDLIRLEICSVQKQKLNYVLCKEKLLPELEMNFKFENFTFSIPMKNYLNVREHFAIFK